MNRKFILFIILLAAIFFVSPAKAHRPRLVYKQVLSQDQPAVIKDPNISQAFYGELKGQADYYQLDLKTPLNFYFGLLSPVIKLDHQDFSAEIITNNVDSLNSSFFTLENPGVLWDPYFEKFAGDKYYKGPEATVPLPAGSYLIRITNPDNQGKYTLFIGKQESFPPSEIINTLLELPTLKRDFFAAPVFSAYFNLIGLFSAIFLAAFIILILLIKKLFLKRVNKNINKNL
ncbi:MAG: hypothetical protein NTX66_01525 [Candidatus Falkowbacteria bacterium]|nr:hypothetical protein [Candidatus Falkowbacteria bacterium]